MFERDNRLVTKIDLPGMKKEDVKVEVTDGQLAISGDRKTEAEETNENFYRCEREYGSFCRAVPLPEGVSVPLPAQPEAKVRKVEIQETSKAAESAA